MKITLISRAVDMAYLWPDQFGNKGYMIAAGHTSLWEARLKIGCLEWGKEASDSTISPGWIQNEYIIYD